MAMGKRLPKQGDLFLVAADLPQSPGVWSKNSADRYLLVRMGLEVTTLGPFRAVTTIVDGSGTPVSALLESHEFHSSSVADAAGYPRWLDP